MAFRFRSGKYRFIANIAADIFGHVLQCNKNRTNGTFTFFVRTVTLSDTFRLIQSFKTGKNPRN